MVLEERGLVLPRPGDLLVLVPGTEGVWMERVLSGTAAAVGPEVELGAVPSSLRLAERVLGLAEAAGGPVRADDHLAFARDAGVPASPLLRTSARAERRRARADAARRAQELGTTLVVPLGLLFLPAFVCTAVVPVVAALAGRALSGS